MKSLFKQVNMRSFTTHLLCGVVVELSPHTMLVSTEIGIVRLGIDWNQSKYEKKIAVGSRIYAVCKPVHLIMGMKEKRYVKYILLPEQEYRKLELAVSTANTKMQKVWREYERFFK